MTELAKNVSSNLDALLRQMLDDVEKFENLRQAIDLREKQLQSLYHVEVAATTLETLVAEYADKKRAFELEHTTQHAELSDSIATKKRSWQREEEEYEYTLKLHRTREQSQFEEGIRKKEAEFQVREDTIKTTEDELETLRSRVANISAEQEKFLQTAEQNVTKRLVAEHTAHTALLEKTWESEKRIFELSFANLETQYKRLETEVIHLKKEAESAQKKAQELAVTVIEHGGRHSVHRNDMRENDEKNAATAT
jgi:hypothetical protein